MTATKPECPYCGATEGLREVHDGGGCTDPEYTCEDCFRPLDDGPNFDDLPKVNVAHMLAMCVMTPAGIYLCALIAEGRLM